MARPPQQIRFCTSRDGVRIAWAISGQGPPLVMAAHWITHLEYDWETLLWRPWLDELSRRHTLIRYDSRGTGLSDREGVEFSREGLVEDLEAVADAAALDRFALLGSSGAGPIAVAYAVQHPERVTHLVLYGAVARGRIVRSKTPEQRAEAETLLKLVEVGWGKDDPSFRQVFLHQTCPDGTAEQLRSLDRLFRMAASPENAAAKMRVQMINDVSAIAPRVRCPTLVLHPRWDARLPFEEGRLLAGLIPGARFVPLESRNHILLESEPAWAHFLEELYGFLLVAPAPSGASEESGLRSLTARELDVLELVAQGLDNGTIGRQLGMSEKTARNHLSTILAKLDVHSRAEAIVRAREAGLGHKRPRRAR